MKRIYESGTRDSVTLFIGTEVEHTPMYGEKTLQGLHLRTVLSISIVVPTKALNFPGTAALIMRTQTGKI
jgi:hypothetical protein